MNRNVEKAKEFASVDSFYHFGDSDIPKRVCEIDNCYKAIDLSATPDWYKVSEGDLPKNEGLYLCVAINGKLVIQSICKFDCNIKEFLNWDGLGYLKFDCVAWTYLPKYEPK